MSNGFRRAAWPTAWLGVASVICACGGPAEELDDAFPAFVTRDSAGVEILESAEPIWTNETRWAVAPDAEVVIKSDAADHHRIFLQIGDIVRLSDGRIVVESTRTRQLFVFSAEGELLDIWGSLGEGPQEFQRMIGMFRCQGDTIVVRDVAHLAVVDPTGHVNRKVRIPSELGLSAVQLRGISHDCGAALLTFQQSSLAQTDFGTVSYPRLTVWASLSGPEIDTVGMVQGEELFEWEGQPARFPFHTMPSWATDGSHLYFGVGDRPEIQVQGRRGQLRRLIRWAVEPEPISGSEWQDYDEERERFLEWEPGWTDFTPPSHIHPHPDWQPIFAAEGDQDWYECGFHFDGEGNLWVRRGRREPLFVRVSQHRAPRPPERWWVFDSTGRWLGEIETPGNFLVKNISGGFLLGVSWDEFDLEEIRGFRIDQGR